LPKSGVARKSAKKSVVSTANRADFRADRLPERQLGPGRPPLVGEDRSGGDGVDADAGDPSLVERTWVLITESPDGGWGIDGHAYTGAEIAEAARRELVP
jgi:hypothetical protein